MKKTIFTFVLALLASMPICSFAQGLKDSGKSAADIVPSGWESSFKTGDLNADGIADLVLIATPCNKEKMKTRDDGYVYNFNQPILAIYWGDKNGNFKLFKQYDKVIPAREDDSGETAVIRMYGGSSGWQASFSAFSGTGRGSFLSRNKTAGQASLSGSDTSVLSVHAEA